MKILTKFIYTNFINLDVIARCSYFFVKVVIESILQNFKSSFNLSSKKMIIIVRL